jgi:DNA-binding LytR/AlgR family response regulator
VIITQIDLNEFFRISRYCIIALSEIRGVVKIMGGRLKVVTDFEPKCEMTVSRARVDEFLEWLA